MAVRESGLTGAQVAENGRMRNTEPPAEGRGETAGAGARSGCRAGLVLVLTVLAAAVSLYRTSERGLFTAHEARAARCARNMLRSQQWPAGRPSPWLVPQFSPVADPGRNYQKPPLYYWAVAGVSRLVGGVTRLTVRLPSAVSFVLLVLMTYYLGKALVSARTGAVAALVLLSTPKMLWWGRAAILDPMLTACIAGSLLFFVRAHLGRGGRWQYWLFWGLAGLGTLVKATALVVPLMTVGLYLLARARSEGFWRPLWRIKPASGVLVLLAVAAPWHAFAHVATAGEFSRIYWGIHVFGRATGTSIFEKTTSWWFYLPVMARDLFPWIIFLPGALVQPWRRASREHLGRMLFPFVWLAGSFVFFSAVSFRKDEYMMVAYPAAAILIGYLFDYYLVVHREDRALGRWMKTGFWIAAVSAFIVGAGILMYSFLPGLQERVLEALHNETDRAVWGAIGDLFARQAWPAVLLVGPLALGTVAAAILIGRGRPAPAVTLLACATLFAFIVFVVIMVPILNETRGLASLADTVRAEAAKRGPGTQVFLAASECHQLAFLLDVDEVSPVCVPGILLDGPLSREPWLVLTDRETFEVAGWADRGLVFTPVLETAPGHRRPMVLLEAKRSGHE
ncbi:MAG: glycosyltransferase family 39 protein [Phycisphaerae bacterium]